MDRNAIAVRQMYRYNRSVSSIKFLSFNVYIVLWILQYFLLAFCFVKFSISSTDITAVLLNKRYTKYLDEYITCSFFPLY